MAIIYQPYQSTDEKTRKTNVSLPMFCGGGFFMQYGSATSYTNSTTETSLYTGITLGASSTNTSNFGKDYPLDSSTLTIPPNSLTIGTIFHVRAFGTITNTGTPTLRFRLGLVNTLAAFTSISDTTALTMSTITGTNDFIAEYEFVVTAVGTSGQVGVHGTVSYGTSTTTLANVSWLIPYANTTIDTTQQWTLDLRATWGAASASNTIINKAGYARIIG